MRILLGPLVIRASHLSLESSDPDVDEMDADADREKAHARQSIEPVRPINGRRGESPVA